MTPDGPEPPPAEERRAPEGEAASRFRLHYVYYALAAFDVLALILSVSILFWITDRYGQSVEVNGYWASRMTESLRLIELASKANAPGNDAFLDPGADLSLREEDLDAALDEFERERARFLEALAGALDPVAGANVSLSLEGVRSSMSRMAEHARDIFRAFGEDNDVGLAGQHMADMDRAYADVLARLRAANLKIAQIQQRNLESQLRIVELLRTVGLAFGGVILVMVFLVTVYGRYLSRRMRGFQAELTAYHDHLEGLVEERTAELEASLERLRLSDRLASIGTLAAGLGHDMNNVLFPVRCRLDALRAAPLDGDAAEDVRSIRQSVEYLQQLTDGLRLLSLDPDEDVGPSATTDLQAWWDEVRPLFLTALPKQATLAGEIAYDLRPVAVAPHRLTQAVFNLVVNAGAAIDERGTVRVWARPSGDDGTVRIGVSDDGRGMSEEVRRQALDPFFTTKKRGLSTGLGLSLVQGIATAAGGRVNVESSPGRGTTVALLLPFAEAGPPDGAERRTPSLHAAVSVEDRRLATFFATLLQAAGFEVDVAGRPGLTSRVWVADAARTTPDEARAFLGGGDGRQVIVFGDPNSKWKDSGVHVVDRAGGVDAMRAAIADICEVRGEGIE